MISFKLEPHEQDFMEEFRFVANSLLRPYAAEADRIADLPESLLQRPELVKLMQAFVPEEFGGGWKSLVKPGRTYSIEKFARMRVMACEEGGYGDPSLFISLPGPGLGYPSLRAQGSPAQQKRFFEPFVGETLKWAAFAVTEPKAGSDVAAISTTARKEGDRYILNGKKWFIGNGARADWLVVFATVNPKQGQFGVRPFVVERGARGFRVGRILPTMGMRAVQLSELIFEDCEVSQDNLLGGQKQEGRSGGFRASVHTFNLVRPGIAAVAVGIARAAVEQLSDFVKHDGARHSSAQSWREVGDRLKAMNRKLEGARLLCWNAAAVADQAKDNTREASMAKSLCAKVAMEVCVESMDIAARTGVQDMSALERLFRNVKVFNILEGTGEIQKLTITKSLLRRQNGEA